jgi:hypothetical protein
VKANKARIYGAVVPRLGGLAKGDAVDRSRISADKGVSARGALRTHESNQEGCGFNAKHIAEGHGRLNTGEFRQFLGIARASNFEVQTQLQIARELEMGDPKQIDDAESLSHEVGKMLYAILESIKG